MPFSTEGISCCGRALVVKATNSCASGDGAAAVAVLTVAMLPPITYACSTRAAAGQVHAPVLVPVRLNVCAALTCTKGATEGPASFASSARVPITEAL